MIGLLSADKGRISPPNVWGISWGGAGLVLTLWYNLVSNAVN